MSALVVCSPQLLAAVPFPAALAPDMSAILLPSLCTLPRSVTLRVCHVVDAPPLVAFDACVFGWRDGNFGLPIPPPLVLSRGDEATGDGFELMRIPPFLRERIQSAERPSRLVYGVENPGPLTCLWFAILGWLRARHACGRVSAGGCLQAHVWEGGWAGGKRQAGDARGGGCCAVYCSQYERVCGARVVVPCAEGCCICMLCFIVYVYIAHAIYARHTMLHKHTCLTFF